MFSSLSTMFTNLASKMSGSSLAANNSAMNTFEIILYSFINEIWTYFYETIVRIVYYIGQWVLVVIDFIFVFVRQMIGINGDFNNLESISKSDLIFQFVFNDTVLRVIRGMLALALVLLLVFTIFAILKSEYDYVVNNGNNSKRQIMVKTLKALFLMVLVPIFVIGGIITSNALLKALYMATAGGEDTSLGTQIFVAASYNAQAYRDYADADKKIPITYNFSEVGPNDDVTTVATEGTVQQVDEAFKAFRESSVWMRGYETFLMIYYDMFFSISTLDELDQIYEKNGLVSPYYSQYDTGLKSKRVEYYVMADVIDYSMNSNRPIFFKTAEEIYNSYNEAIKLTHDSSIPKSIPITYSPDKNVEITSYDGTKSVRQGAYEFEVTYRNESGSTLYTHAKGATDEAMGAVFMIAIEKEAVTDRGEVVKYYYPLLSSENNFATEYHDISGQPVVAKGIFDDGKNPTAIKVEDNVVRFYHDDLNIPTLTDFFPKISYEGPPPGTTMDPTSWLLKEGISNIIGADPFAFVPYIYYSFDLFSLFQKKTYNVLELDNGKVYLDYMFNSEGTRIENFYNLKHFHIFILIAAAILLLKILLTLMFGVARRVMNLLLLIISYPAVLASYPIDDGNRFKGWVQAFLEQLFSIYGIVIAMNIVLLLVPLVNSIEILTPDLIEHMVIVNKLPLNFTSTFGNMLLHLMFICVAFSSIRGYADTIESLISGIDKKNAGGLIKEGEQTVNDLKKIPKQIGNIISGKFLVDAVKGAGNMVAGIVPGGAIVAEVADKIKHKSMMEKMKENAEDMQNQLNNGDASKKSEEAKQAEGEAAADKTDSGGGDAATPEGEAQGAAESAGEGANAGAEAAGGGAEGGAPGGEMSGAGGGAGSGSGAGGFDVGDIADVGASIFSETREEFAPARTTADFEREEETGEKPRKRKGYYEKGLVSAVKTFAGDVKEKIKKKEAEQTEKLMKFMAKFHPAGALEKAEGAAEEKAEEAAEKQAEKKGETSGETPPEETSGETDNTSAENSNSGVVNMQGRVTSGVNEETEQGSDKNTPREGDVETSEGRLKGADQPTESPKETSDADNGNLNTKKDKETEEADPNAERGNLKGDKDEEGKDKEDKDKDKKDDKDEKKDEKKDDKSSNKNGSNKGNSPKPQPKNSPQPTNNSQPTNSNKAQTENATEPQPNAGATPANNSSQTSKQKRKVTSKDAVGRAQHTAAAKDGSGSFTWDLDGIDVRDPEGESVFRQLVSMQTALREGGSSMGSYEEQSTNIPIYKPKAKKRKDGTYKESDIIDHQKEVTRNRIEILQGAKEGRFGRGNGGDNSKGFEVDQRDNLDEAAFRVGAMRLLDGRLAVMRTTDVGRVYSDRDGRYGNTFTDVMIFDKDVQLEDIDVDSLGLKKGLSKEERTNMGDTGKN